MEVWATTLFTGTCQQKASTILLRSNSLGSHPQQGHQQGLRRGSQKRWRNSGIYQTFSWYDTVVAMSKAFTHGKEKVRSTIPDPNHHLNTLDVKDKYSYLKTPRWNGMHGGRTAGTCAGRLCQRHRRIPCCSWQSAYRFECTGYSPVLNIGKNGSQRFWMRIDCTVGQRILWPLISNIKTVIREWQTPVFNPETWPKTAFGVGFAEAPRGALCPLDQHRRSEDCQLSAGSPYHMECFTQRYQRPDVGLWIITDRHTGSRWNTTTGNHQNHPQFDPCMACSVHLYDEEGTTVSRVKVGD